MTVEEANQLLDSARELLLSQADDIAKLKTELTIKSKELATLKAELDRVRSKLNSYENGFLKPSKPWRK